MVRTAAVVTNVAAGRVPKRVWVEVRAGKAVAPVNAPIAGRDRAAIRDGRIAGRSRMAVGGRSLRLCNQRDRLCSAPKAVGAGIVIPAR